MFTKRFIVSALCAAGLIGGAATSLPGMADVDISLNFAPPAPQYEVVPAPRAGYVWSPGHYVYRDGRHVWVSGSFIAERPGYVYHAPRWVERSGRWYYQAPRWDRDGDGVANRFDRDRDGDGVRNRFDSRPNNPNRY
jgi:hypothetical protein